MSSKLFEEHFEVTKWLQKGNEKENSLFVAKKLPHAQDFYAKYDLTCSEFIPYTTVFKIFANPVEYSAEKFALSIGTSEQLSVPVLYSSGIIRLPETTVMFVEIEYLNGKAFHPSSKEQIKPALIQCCKTMHQFHSMGIVHNDLKPEHFVQTNEGDIVVVDFGVCENLCNPIGSIQWSGSFPYIAPERLEQPQKNRSSKSDVWSVGIVLLSWISNTKASELLPAKNVQDLLVQSQELVKTLPAMKEQLASSGGLRWDETLFEACLLMLALDPKQRISFKQLLAKYDP
jgi:serine/threonine protein kinase